MKATKYLMMAAAAMMIAACSSNELDSAASGSDSMIALDIMPMVQGQTDHDCEHRCDNRRGKRYIL